MLKKVIVIRQWDLTEIWESSYKHKHPNFLSVGVASLFSFYAFESIHLANPFLHAWTGTGTGTGIRAALQNVRVAQ